MEASYAVDDTMFYVD